MPPADHQPALRKDGARAVHVSQRDQGWLFALLPAFPLALLVMRLWYASRQNTQVLLLLVQYISPLGLLSAVLLTTVWALPVFVLAARLLGALYRLSTGRTSWLVRTADRVPDWVVVLAVLMAVLGWQLRFLPILLTLTLAVAGLTVRERHPEKINRIRTACLVVPVAVGVLAYALLYPAIGQAAAEGDMTTLILLAVPPALTPFLTGPVPPAFGRLIAGGTAWGLLVLFPLIAGSVVLRAPVLPLIAVEVAAEESREKDKKTREETGEAREEAGKAQEEDGDRREVVVGYLIAGDENVQTMLERSGEVRFLPNDRLLARVLCPDPDAVPYSPIQLHEWHVEASMLSWLAPAPLPAVRDPRCEGRPAPAAAE